MCNCNPGRDAVIERLREALTVAVSLTQSAAARIRNVDLTEATLINHTARKALDDTRTPHPEIKCCCK